MIAIDAHQSGQPPESNEHTIVGSCQLLQYILGDGPAAAFVEDLTPGDQNQMRQILRLVEMLLEQLTPTERVVLRLKWGIGQPPMMRQQAAQAISAAAAKRGNISQSMGADEVGRLSMIAEDKLMRPDMVARVKLSLGEISRS